MITYEHFLFLLELSMLGNARRVYEDSRGIPTGTPDTGICMILAKCI